MRKQVIAVAVASALAFAAGAFAQQRASTKAQEMEAVVTVTKVDPATRIVYARSRKGQTAVHLPPDIDISQIREGSRYRVRYSEPVATAIEHGAQAAAAGATAEAKPGEKPGEGVKTAKVSGLLEAKDAQQITVRTRDGQTQTFKLGEGVSAESITTGDGVMVTYQQAVASRMVSTPQQVTDPAPAQ